MLILLEILKGRIRPGHSKIPDIERDLAKRWAGYWGEIALANYVKELPQDKYLILHDLQLQLNGIHFQIDSLLLSKNFILIIEAKNIIGTLTFDNVFHQLIRKNPDETEECFEDPRVQCKRLQSLLRGWLVKHHMNVLPIETLIFFKSTRTILKTNTNDKVDFSKICKARDIFNKIDELEKKYAQEKVNQQTISKMGKMLLKHHSPTLINILEIYKLSERDIQTGVCCPKCLGIPMNYQRGKWLCSTCNTSSKDAYLEALNDYFYIIKPMVANCEFRLFLHLPNNNTAQKILRSLQLPTTGKTKDRLYHQPKEKVLPCAFLSKMSY